MTKPDDEAVSEASAGAKPGAGIVDVGDIDVGDDDGKPVPKLPRGSGFKLSTPQLMRIGMTVVTLIAIVALQKPCSSAVGRFVTTFGASDEPKATQPAPAASAPGASQPAPSEAASSPTSGASGAPTANPSTVTGPDRGAPAGAPPIQYERLTPSMTDDELRAAIERAKRRAAAAEAAKAAAPPPAPPTAPPSPPSPTPSPTPAPNGGGQ